MSIAHYRSIAEQREAEMAQNIEIGRARDLAAADNMAKLHRECNPEQYQQSPTEETSLGISQAGKATDFDSVIPGSSPGSPANKERFKKPSAPRASVAQKVERPVEAREATGSIPVRGTKKVDKPTSKEVK